jgi:hypothetical protein
LGEMVKYIKYIQYKNKGWTAKGAAPQKLCSLGVENCPLVEML